MRKAVQRDACAKKFNENMRKAVYLDKCVRTFEVCAMLFNKTNA